MYNFKRTLCFILVLTMAFTSMNLQVFAASNTDYDAVAKEVYESLSPEAQKIFLDSIISEAMSGDDELLEYHKSNIDSTFKGSADIMVSRVRVFTGLRASSASASLASDLRALGLPSAVRYALTALGAAISVPGEVILDAIAAVGLIAIVAIYWDDVRGKWYQIEKVFKSHFSAKANDIRSAFRFVKKEAEKPKGKITSKAKKEMKKRDRSGKLRSAMEKALKKGWARKEGDSGVKKLSGKGIQGYKYEIKLKGTWGKYRLLGNIGSDGVIIFEKLYEKN